ncbi:unnamed protein product [Mycena citricolor]|uniref:Secreted protein n=1 Tax=Mycena citricolor TaxID=2018698 RepID=A0AAD2HYN2_9AGAR|nr:unnamed protein product [Mycena citricolor]CAK5283564.1 unnamed protein product [Mycena citricolor]
MRLWRGKMMVLMMPIAASLAEGGMRVGTGTCAALARACAVRVREQGLRMAAWMWVAVAPNVDAELVFGEHLLDPGKDGHLRGGGAGGTHGLGECLYGARGNAGVDADGWAKQGHGRGARKRERERKEEQNNSTRPSILTAVMYVSSCRTHITPRRLRCYAWEKWSPAGSPPTGHSGLLAADDEERVERSPTEYGLRSSSKHEHVIDIVQGIHRDRDWQWAIHEAD